MKKFVAGIFIATFMSGCMTVASRPAVSDFNGSSVRIQVHGNSVYNTRPNAEDTALATATCRSKQSNSRAQYASSRTEVAYFRNEHFFLCVE